MRIHERGGGPDDRLTKALAGLRSEFELPGEFAPEVLAAAAEAAAVPPSAGGDRVDRLDVEFQTLDPATSTDLDQAFAVELAGDDVILRYAIADVGYFVDADGPVADAAWQRGMTRYLPDGRIPLYPTTLCEDAASLLPDGPRPAVVFIVRVDGEGEPTLDGVERAVVQSRAKLAYDAVQVDELPKAMVELSWRIVAAEERRGAPRVEFPEQELNRDDDGRWRLEFRPRLESENFNAGMSLATNLAVAKLMQEHETGLFRVMEEPGEWAYGRLRHTARAVGLDWPSDVDLGPFERSLDPSDPQAAAFLLAVRRSSGGASYQPYSAGEKPWHSAMAATYAHATAPLRRLADRYVIDAAIALANGAAVPDYVDAAFDRLPEVMEEAENESNRVDAAVLDLAEAVLLAGREGEVFTGVIVDEDDRGARIQIADPAVLVRLRARKANPGDEVQAKLVVADPETRTVEFERVG